MRIHSLVLISSLLWSLSAYADKVPPPPESCPSGSIGDTGHEGPHCVPLSCSVDADCKDGGLCKETPLCLEEKMLASGRSREKSLYVFVEGGCEDASTCKAPASCKPGKRCVKPAEGSPPPSTTETRTPEAPSKTPTTTPPTPASKCSISAPTSSEGVFWSLLALGLLWRRRSL